ncbi:hypothetical protein FQR65_LT00958 [Abscondita terminalis]|nr:hypothetical protein FQR65_LT00958 [Abscondita terminalis]
MGDETNAKQTTVTTLEHQPRMIKSRPPKFTSPIVGKIVDQGVDVVLEGIIDGYPTPTIKWEKNGTDITDNEKISKSYELNKVKIEIKNVTTNDGGRYTCTAINDAGSAISTSDLVVRKTVFPPVFGRRLQAQVVKKGDRVHMEIEVTGTPTPTVTWFKDDKPIKEVLPPGHKIVVHGNSHTLIIEKVDFGHTGKYMARAVNEGGEAQSIADFAVFEPTPDTMVEVVKTVVFEDVHKHETLAKAAEQSKTTFTAPQVKSIPISISKPQPVSLVSLKSIPKSYIESSENISESHSSSQAEYSTLTETTVSKESKTIRVESNTAGFSPEIFKESVQTPLPITIEKPVDVPSQYPTSLTTEQVDAGIETSSITKQSSLDYFVQKLKENDEPIKSKELPKGTPLQPDIYTKFEEVKQPEYPSFLTKKTEEKVHESAFSQKSYINEPFSLIPEPPPEICYTPKRETYQDISRNLKSETIEKHSHYETKLTTSSPSIRPVSPRPSAEALEMEKLWTPHREPERPLVSSPLPIRPISSASEPSAEGKAMEKAWAHKSEIHREHIWPPTQPIEETKSWSTQTTLEKKWAPVQTKSETIIKESRTTSEPIPHPIHYIAKVTDLHEKGYGHISSTVESTEIKENVVYEHSAKPSEIVKSWPPPSRVEEPKPTYKPVMPSIHSLSIRPASVQDITDEVYLEPGPPPEIDYAPAPCEIKTVPPPLPPKQERPQAPPVPARPFRTTETKTDNQPFRRMPKLQPLPFQAEEAKPKPIKPGPPPTPSKFFKGRFTDSDYESDYESSKIPVKWKPYTSDTEEPSYRHVKAPKFTPVARSKSVEPEPLPQISQPTYIHQPYKPTLYTPKFVEQKREISPPLLKPGTPPEYLQTDTKYHGETKQVIDGYMADTDEPLTLRKKISKFESKHHEMKSEYYSSSSESSRQKISYESQSMTKPTTPKFYRKTTTTVPAPKKV